MSVHITTVHNVKNTHVKISIGMVLQVQPIAEVPANCCKCTIMARTEVVDSRREQVLQQDIEDYLSRVALRYSRRSLRLAVPEWDWQPRGLAKRQSEGNLSN
jgi:hypothetical protein